MDGRGQECEAKKVLKITSDIIRNIIQNAALIVQVQNWGISRKDDYKKFLELFLKCEDLEEAHKLSAHVFGVQQIEHYKTNIPRDEDGINNSVYQEEPAMFLLKPHTRGYRERKDRTGFADKSLEKWHSGKATCDRCRSRRKWYSGILGRRRFGLRRLMKWFPKTHAPFSCSGSHRLI